MVRSMNLNGWAEKRHICRQRCRWQTNSNRRESESVRRIIRGERHFEQVPSHGPSFVGFSVANITYSNIPQRPCHALCLLLSKPLYAG